VRNNALAAVLAAALVVGCRRSSEPSAVAEPSPTLAAPGAMVTSPLSKSATGYTNEMQAQYIQDQAVTLGIQRFASSNRSDSETDTAAPGVSYAEGFERTKELEAALASQRRQIDRNKPKTVDLPGNTPMLLQTPSEGAGTSVPAAAPPSTPQ
jgi:hypothetical protein